MSVLNTLAKLRAEHKLSAVDLASAAGVTRQTIYAIENGTFVPNTAVALRLASILGVSVEELFRLEESEPPLLPVAVLSTGEPPAPGQLLQLGRIGKQTVGLHAEATGAFLPQGDALYLGDNQARLLPNASSDKILIAGCDPALSVLARHAALAGVGILALHRNTSEALELLRKGLIHIAGTHGQGDAKLPGRAFQVLPFASWEQGLVVRSSRVKSLEDFVGGRLRLVNREPGSGTRLLLDHSLQHLGIAARSIHGYDTLSYGHLAVARQVKLGIADGCLATRSAAAHFGLRLVPLTAENYNLVVRRQTLQLPAVQTIFHVISQGSFRREIETVGAYKLV